jgi:solute carrier family 25 uncoupling protein 8/9
MVRNEGLLAPWKGVAAGVQRQLIFAPIRIGLYEPVRNWVMSRGGRRVVASGQLPTIGEKIAAGLMTSAIGITVASPADVVKVRLQAQGRNPNVPPRYTGLVNAYQAIFKQEGFKAYWTGFLPNLARNCIVNATELVAYDQTKQTLLTRGWVDDARLHILCGLSAGVWATAMGSPVDVVKTRVMNSQKGEFKSALDCAVKLLKKDGPLGFYKGVFPNFVRIASWNIVAWSTLERLKSWYNETHSN